MSGRVTIKDVAREAGVSIKTVSNVLNNSGSMRPETRRRVEATIKKLGYTMNVAARAMKTGDTKLIGLAVFNFSQPFVPYLADAVIDYARERGYGVIISTYGLYEEGGLPSIIDETYRMGADGWIFFADRVLPDEGSLLNQPYPVVLIGDYLAYGKADWVTMPNVDALKSVTGKLLDRGMRRIALVGAPCIVMREGVSLYSQFDECVRSEVLSVNQGTNELRTLGYVKAFKERDIPIDWSMVAATGEWNQAGGLRAMQRILNEGDSIPEAVICLADALAFGAVHELNYRGFRVPEDVQVVGFDNVPESRYSIPALTTIDPHVAQYAQRAVDMLIERIEGKKHDVRVFTTDYELIERQSTTLSG